MLHSPVPSDERDVLPAAAASERKVFGRHSAISWIITAGLIALVLKFAIAASTVGDEDVLAFYRFGRSVTEHGLEWTYRHDRALNHPPLVAAYLQLIYAADRIPLLRESGLSFPLLLKTPAIVADFLVVLLLARLRRKLSLPTWSLILLALSPVSLMVSGYHGNTDPVMVMFLVYATWQCMRGAPVWCGILLALSCQIKIVPLFLTPIFFFIWMTRGRVIPFLLSFAATMIALWSQPLFNFPFLFLKSVLLYGGFWGCWGITYWLRLTGARAFGAVGYLSLPMAEQVVMTALKLFIVAGSLLIGWRGRHAQGRAVFSSLALAWVVFYILSPAVAPQYMVWLIPFVVILSPRFGAYLIATSSLFLFFFYNTTSRGGWDISVADAATNEVTTPWALWPWSVLVGGLVLLYRATRARHPDFRFFSAKPLPLD